MKVFITGTDTGVGKTEVACSILRLARRKGFQTRALKPIETGVLGERNQDGGWSDQKLLSAAAGSEAARYMHWRLPASPWIAGAAEQSFVDSCELEHWIDSESALGEFVVCEGAGGWRVPINNNDDYCHIVKRLGWPVIVVAQGKLGTVNHTLITVDAILQAGLDCAVIYNGDPDSAEQSFAQITARLSVPVWNYRRPDQLSFRELEHWLKRVYSRD